MTTTKKIATKQKTNQQSNRNIKIIDERAKDIYVDGISALMTGPTITKISFHTTIESDDEDETREIVLRLVMSTESMLRLVENLKSTTQRNRETLTNGVNSHHQRMLDLLEKSQSE